MSLDDYKKLLSSQPEGKRTLETVEISHSFFGETFYFVRDSVDLTVTDPAIVGGVFTAANIESTNALNTNDLDQEATFTFSDIDNVLDCRLDCIDFGNTEPILLTYRIYHSDFLSLPEEGPIVYNVNSVSQVKGAFALSVGLIKLNAHATGLTYNLTDFPMLRGLL